MSPVARWGALLALLCVASSGAETGDAGLLNLDDLADSLAFPSDGAVVCTTRTTVKRISEEERSASRAHALRAMSECRGRSVRADYVPAAARPFIQQQELTWQFERITFGDSAWTVRVSGTTLGDDLETTRIRDGDEVTVFHGRGEGRRAVQRFQYLGPLESCTGTLLRMARMQEQLLALSSAEPHDRDAASGAGGAPGSVRWMIDTTSPGFWTDFEGAWPAHGVIETSSSVEVICDYGADGPSELVLRWHDCFGHPILQTSIRWAAGRRLPVAMGEVRYLSGSDEAIWRSETQIGDDLSAGDELLSWDPQPRDSVEDLRFLDVPTRYQVGDDGEVVADAQILAAAEAQLVLDLSLRGLVGDSATFRSGEPLRVGALPGFVVSPGSLQLGVRPLGTRLPVQFTLSNESDHPLFLSSLDTDCGCLRAAFSDQVIMPDQHVLLTAEQAIQRAGLQEVHIRFDVSGKESQAQPVDVSVEYEGAPGVSVMPDSIPLGTTMQTEWPRDVAFRIIEMGCAYQQPPQLSVTGDFDGHVEAVPESPGVWLATGAVMPRSRSPFGPLEGSVEVASRCAASGVPHVDVGARLVATSVPAGWGGWPSLRVVVRTGGEGTVLLPEVRADEVSIESVESGTLALDVESSERGAVVRVQSSYRLMEPGSAKVSTAWLQIDGVAVRIQIVEHTISARPTGS